MSDVDRLVGDWIIHKFIHGETYSAAYPYGYDSNIHGPEEGVSVVKADAEWECGCYSDYTRDDQYVMTAILNTKSGYYKVTYGHWDDIPSFIQELGDFEQRNCRYEEIE